MEVFYNQNSRKAEQSFGGVELLKYVWRLFSGLMGCGEAVDRKEGCPETYLKPPIWRIKIGYLASGQLRTIDID